MVLPACSSSLLTRGARLGPISHSQMPPGSRALHHQAQRHSSGSRGSRQIFTLTHGRAATGRGLSAQSRPMPWILPEAGHDLLAWREIWRSPRQSTTRRRGMAGTRVFGSADAGGAAPVPTRRPAYKSRPQSFQIPGSGLHGSPLRPELIELLRHDASGTPRSQFSAAAFWMRTTHMPFTADFVGIAHALSALEHLAFRRQIDFRHMVRIDFSRVHAATTKRGHTSVDAKIGSTRSADFSLPPGWHPRSCSAPITPPEASPRVAPLLHVNLGRDGDAALIWTRQCCRWTARSQS